MTFVFAIGAVGFLFAISPQQSGPRLRGKLTSCLGGRRNPPRHCMAQIDARPPLDVLAPWGKPGDEVTIVEMRTAFSSSSYFSVAPGGDL
jgi:hypothetical protein